MSDLPVPFRECPRYYNENIDAFSQCSNVSNFCRHAKDIYISGILIKWTVFIIPSVICFFALMLNIYVFYVLIPSFRKMDDRTKKRYIFILSRAFSSTMSILSILLLPAVVLFTAYNFWFIAVFIIFDMISFLSFLGGHVGATVTIYVAVVHPVYYRHELSYRKCVFLIALLWTCSLIVGTGCGIVQAAFMGSNVPFKCDYYTCEKPVLMFAVASISLTFAFSLLIQSYVIFSLFRHQKQSKERGDFSNTTKLMEGVGRRLVSGLFLFAVMAAFEITSAFLLVNSVFSFTGQEPFCEIFASTGSRLEVVILCALLTLIWSFGLLMDPIFTIVFDPVFHKKLNDHVSFLKSKISHSANTQSVNSVISEFHD